MRFIALTARRARYTVFGLWLLSPLTALSASQFVDTQQGTVLDVTTGLLWQQGKSDFVLVRKDAIAYCNQLVLADRNDWRLPTAKEILSLLRSRNGEFQSLDTRVFPSEARAARYWSSSVRNGLDSTSYWSVNYAGLGLTARRANQKYSVRCVRSADLR